MIRALLLAFLALPAVAQTTVIYSRADGVQAHRAAMLASIYEPVLIDTALAPGVPWRDMITIGICKSKRVLLLWSKRSSESVEVAREIQTARLCNVAILPVLLDSTPLPSDVGHVQAVDWR